MAYTDIDDPTLHFSTTLWTGNGSDDRNITVDGTGMTPGFVVIKCRTQAYHNYAFDSLRGAGQRVETNSDSAETSQANELQSFASTGFQVGSDNGMNKNTDTYVAWSWKSSDTTVNDTTSGYLANSQRVNETAGFTNLTYTGNASNTVVNTGLSDPLDMSITKRRDDTGDWIVWHRFNTGTEGRNYLQLNEANPSQNSATIFQNIAHQMFGSNSIQAMGANSSINVNNATYVSWGWSSRKGYSKFGSYKGNANADGPFVYTGFRPAFIMLKNVADTGDNWTIYDNKRDPDNLSQQLLFANSTSTESTGNNMDIFSNGFKQRNTSNGNNGSDDVLVYMAIAEAPFVNSKGVPCNAR